MKVKNIFWKRIIIGLSFVLFSTLTLLASPSAAEIKNLFDRYQSLHGQYVEAIRQGAGESKVKAIGADLKQAYNDYYEVLGIKPDAKAGYPAELPKYEVKDSDEESQALAPEDIQAETKNTKKLSKDREKFNKLLTKLYSPERDKTAADLRKELQAFIKECKDPEVLKEANFELADLVFDMTGMLKEAQKVLVSYVKRANDPASRQQALSKLKMYRQKAKVNKLRKNYLTIQNETVSKWKGFTSTSWLNFPKKLFKLGSYGVTNFNRFFRARKLDKALDEFNQAVLATLPEGSTEALTRSKVLPCNRVKMLVNGRTSFHYRFENAKRAQYSLYVQTLLFQDDETGNKLTDIMIDRAQNGVDVRLILDDFFSFNKKGGVIQRLKNGGVKVLINNPILKNVVKANFRSHQKLFIIDEKVAIVGGMNIGDEYAKGEIEQYGWRDTDVEVRGPIVREILKLFESNWEELTLDKWNETGEAKYKKAKTEVNTFGGLKDVSKLIPGPIPVCFDTPPVFDNVNARFVTTEPIEDKDDNVLDLFIIYLDRAKHEVIFESAYFIPTDRLTQAIERASARGVKVKIITNSIESNNHPSGGWAGRYSYESILNAGAEIYEWRGAQTVHSKVSLFDDFAVTLGAYNMNSRSHACDSEDIISFEDFRVARGFKTMLYKDLARCKQITMSDVQSWDEDFMKKMKLKFFNMFKFIF